MRYLAAFLFLIGVVCLFHDVPRAQVPVTGAGRGAHAVAAPSGGACSALVVSTATLIGCWDADEGVTQSGGPVTSWVDQTNGVSLGLNVVGSEPSPTSPTYSASSYNSLAGITFAAGSGNYLASSSLSAAYNGVTNLAVFAAVTMTSSAATFGRLISIQSNGHTDCCTSTDSIAAILKNNTSSGYSFFFDNAEGAAGCQTSITLSTPTRIGMTLQGSGGAIYKNGVAQGVGCTAAGSISLSNTSGKFSVGDGAGGTSAFWDGVVRRIVIMSGIPSGTDLSNVDTFLQN